MSGFQRERPPAGEGDRVPAPVPTRPRPAAGETGVIPLDAATARPFGADPVPMVPGQESVPMPAPSEGRQPEQGIVGSMRVAPAGSGLVDPREAVMAGKPETAPSLFGSPGGSALAESLAVPGLLVDDASSELEPGQMRRSDFLAELRGAVTLAASEELAGSAWSAQGCPWIEYWFTYYAQRDSRAVERALRLFARETARATVASEYIPLVAERVRRAVGVWAATGEVGGVPGREAVEASHGGGGAASADDPGRVRAELGEGAPLDARVRGRMESAFASDFSGVRLHTDAGAARLSSRLQARAFAVGSHVAFAPGEYRPGTPMGDALIAHELAHVLQQQGGPGSAPLAGAQGLELDADRSARGAVASLWAGSRGLADLARSVGPRVRSGLRISRCSGGGPRPATEPHPTGISNTVAKGSPLHYGSFYTHTFSSSTGSVADLNGVVIGERVTVGRDDFATGWGGVPLGTITATANAAGKIDDNIGTPAGLIHAAMPGVRALPAVMETPQTLHWKDRTGSWNQFVAVAITFTVRAGAGGTMEAVTVDNGVPVVEPFTGPPPGGAPAPAPAPAPGPAPAPPAPPAPAPPPGGGP
jgi:hypothetical protein